MDRRLFIKTGTVLSIVAGIGTRLEAKDRRTARKRPAYGTGVNRDVQAYGPLKIKEITINAGLKKPVTFLQVSDSHISCADSRDVQIKIDLAAGRSAGWPDAMRNWFEALRFAQDNDLMIVHTGDFEDFVSEANLDVIAKSLKSVDSFCCPGNHEFSKFVGEAKEDAAYKASSFQKVQDAYPNSLDVCSRIVGGVNLVSLDDVYYNVTPSQFEKVRNEFSKGLPVVLICHVPFYTQDLCESSLARMNGYCAYLTGVPEEITSTFQNDPSLPEELQWKNRAVQQHADATTLEFVSWLKEQKALKGILCGHLHYFYEGPFSATANQYVCGAGYNGEAHLVTIK